MYKLRPSCSFSWPSLLVLDFFSWTTVSFLSVFSSSLSKHSEEPCSGMWEWGLMWRWAHDVGCRYVKLQRWALQDWRKVIFTALTTISSSLLSTVILDGGNWDWPTNPPEHEMNEVYFIVANSFYFIFNNLSIAFAELPTNAKGIGSNHIVHGEAESINRHSSCFHVLR